MSRKNGIVGLFATEKSWISDISILILKKMLSLFEHEIVFHNLGARYTFVEFKHVGNLGTDGSIAVLWMGFLPSLFSRYS